MDHGYTIGRALSAYERYLNVYGSGCVGSQVPVATFATWSGLKSSLSDLGSLGSDLTRCLSQELLDGGEDASVQFKGESECDEATSAAPCAVRCCDGYETLVGDKCVGEKEVEVSTIARGPNWERNRLWNAERKARKAKRKETHVDVRLNRGFFSDCDAEVRGKLKNTRALRFIAENEREMERASRELFELKSGRGVGSRSAFLGCGEEVKTTLAQTRAARLIAENKRETMRASREIQVLEADDDVQLEVQKRRVAARAVTERDMVSIEKTHAALAASGNVPGDLTGFAATIIGSGSISPDSSASLQEFRKCQKALLDSEAKVEQLKKVLCEAGVEVPCGPRTQRSNDHARDIWTDNEETRQFLDEKYSGGYGEQPLSDYGLPGKIRVIGFPDEDYY